MKLYKSTFTLEIMCMANSQSEANEVAKKHLEQESKFISCDSKLIKSKFDIPKNWENVIPYYPKGVLVKETCLNLVKDNEEIKPEIKPEVKPETRFSSKYPELKFDIPVKTIKVKKP